MHLCCLLWCRVMVSHVWKPRDTTAVMVQVVSMVFRWAFFCSPLHKGYVLQKLVLLYTKLYILRSSAVHYFHSERCFFICNTSDCISSFGLRGSYLTNMLPTGMRLRLWHLVCHREEFWDLFTSFTCSTLLQSNYSTGTIRSSK